MIVFVDIIYEGDARMIKILQKGRLPLKAVLLKVGSVSCRVFGDTLNSTINFQFEMFGKIDSAAAAGTKSRNNTVFAKQ